MTEQSAGDRKKICIIEDEPAMIELVSLILRNRGFDVPRRRADAGLAAPTEFVEAPVTRTNKVGRNDPCPCGSGKKYKKCCFLCQVVILFHARDDMLIWANWLVSTLYSKITYHLLPETVLVLHARFQCIMEKPQIVCVIVRVLPGRGQEEDCIGPPFSSTAD